MLGSLYGVAPLSTHTWSISGAAASRTAPNTPNPSSSEPSRRHGRGQAANANRTQPAALTAHGAALAALASEEAAMAARKLNIRRFGATWLRPPGIPKTLQAMHDEEIEKAEVAEAERRARVLAEETAAAEEAARRAAGGVVDGTDEGGAVGDAMGEAMARDLDAEIPGGEGEGVSGIDYDEEDGENDEIDLDEDVPDAGQYEHTDTDIEDSDSEEDVDATGLTEGTVHSMNRSSLMEED